MHDGDARGAGGFLHPVSCSSGSKDWSHETDGALGQQNPSVTQAGGGGCDGEEIHLALGTLWLCCVVFSPHLLPFRSFQEKDPKTREIHADFQAPGAEEALVGCVLKKHRGSWLAGPQL